MLLIHLSTSVDVRRFGVFSVFQILPFLLLLLLLKVTQVEKHRRETVNLQHIDHGNVSTMSEAAFWETMYLC